MQKFIIMSFFTLLCSIFGCQAQNNKFKSMSVDEFEKCIANTSIVRLDVRTADEYAGGHIQGALNINVLQSDFKTKALSTLPKDKTIAVYCRSGRRSKMAANILSENGFNVVELSTGYNGWTGAGKAVTK